MVSYHQGLLPTKIGQSAVEAGIVSPIMVVVVALTAISNFAFPQYTAAISIRLLRFVMMLGASVWRNLFVRTSINRLLSKRPSMFHPLDRKRSDPSKP
ncbi:spore germination protein [Brevibacillus composti]|uniref:spore germination protein n=1 Tax=Brevibacillus composti TaxID=2796470 RepID=UPI00226B0C4B|nr:spore germination protein [Brevibacillus composti]